MWSILRKFPTSEPSCPRNNTLLARHATLVENSSTEGELYYLTGDGLNSLRILRGANSSLIGGRNLN